MSNTSCRSIREHLKFVHEKNESQPASVYQLKNALEKTNLSLHSRNLKAYKSTTEQNACNSAELPPCRTNQGRSPPPWAPIWGRVLGKADSSANRSRSGRGEGRPPRRCRQSNQGRSIKRWLGLRAPCLTRTATCHGPSKQQGDLSAREEREGELTMGMEEQERRHRCRCWYSGWRS